MKGYVYFDSGYAPCAFLIVKEDGNPYKEEDTVLIQTDWDYPAIASCFGYAPCKCGFTDGTVDCEHKTASQMISEAFDCIVEHEGELSEELGNYFG